MIMYDFRCDECKGVKEALVKSSDIETYPCPVCGGDMRKILTTRQTPNESYFPSGWFEGISWEPKYISSRGQLSEECKKHGCYSKYLDGYAGWR